METKDLRDQVIRTIRSTGLSTSLAQEHPDTYAFFRALFQRHPDAERKRVADIVDIRIRKFPKSRQLEPLPVQDHQFMIVLADGSEDSISWWSCVNAQKVPVERQLYRAMRHAIQDQTYEYKQRNRYTPCNICGTHSNLTVDHVTKFQTLKNTFLQLHPDHPTEFARTDCGQTIFREEDAEYCLAWRRYHYNNAVFQILCKPCNESLDGYGANHI